MLDFVTCAARPDFPTIRVGEAVAGSSSARLPMHEGDRKTRSNKRQNVRRLHSVSLLASEGSGETRGERREETGDGRVKERREESGK